LLSKRLRASLDKDPVAPVLEAAWYPALERRLVIILNMVERCIAANGLANVLVTDD